MNNERFHSCIYPSSLTVLTNNFFTGLQFRVEQASRSLSAIAELLVCFSLGDLINVI